ncbi:MAG: fasciclin domain-containing protein [Actinomycetota bacterium]
MIAGGVVAAVALVGALVVAARPTDRSDRERLYGSVGVELIRTGPDGAPGSVDVTAVVFVDDAGVAPFQWIVPDDPTRRRVAMQSTDTSGRVEFRWAPLAAWRGESWASTVEFHEPWPDPTLVPPAVNCSLRRGGPTDVTPSDEVPVGEVPVGEVPVDATVSIEPLDGADLRPAGADDPIVGSLVIRLPNVWMGLGDDLSCAVRGDVPGARTTLDDAAAGADVSTTTSSPSTTAADPTTDPVAASTTSPADEPAVSPTTDVPGAVTSTTIPIVTATTTSTPPTATSTTVVAATTTTTEAPATTTAPTTTLTSSPATLTEILAAEPDLAEFLQLVRVSGLATELDAAQQPFTLFAPLDGPVAALRAERSDLDFTSVEVARAVVLAHLGLGERLDRATLVERTEIPVADGGVQIVDSADPLIVAEANVVRADIAAPEGIVHVVDGVFPTDL